MQHKAQLKALGHQQAAEPVSRPYQERKTTGGDCHSLDDPAHNAAVVMAAVKTERGPPRKIWFSCQNLWSPPSPHPHPTNAHAPREHKSVHYLYNEDLLTQQGSLPKLVQNDLRK